MQVSSKNENQEIRSECISQMKIKSSTFDQNMKFFAHFIKITKPSAFFIKFTKPFASFFKITKSFAFFVKSITSFVIFDKIIKSFVTRESYNDVYDDLIIQKKKLLKSRAAFTFILMSNNHNISQSQSNKYVQKLKAKNKKVKDDRNILYTGTINMFKAKAFSKFNMMTRRHYLAYLNKKNKDKFVQDIFSELFFTDSFYIEVKKNVAKSFK